MGKTLRLALVLLSTVALFSLRAAPAAAAAGISVSPNSGPWGISVTVTGSGFGPGETGISVTYDTTTMASGITATTPGGGWTTTFTVPFSAPGAHTISASGSVTVVPVTTNYTVPNPAIALGRTSGPPGVSVSISGSGFGASESGITVTYESTTVLSGITASVQGTWSNAFVVPVSAGGPRTVKASGASTLASSVPAQTFVIAPAISASRASGAAGNSVTVNGSGFGASESGITVTYDGSNVAPGISANADGTWNTTFTVPASAGGLHSIRASGSITQSFSVPDLSFTVNPGISLSRTTGTPGTSVTVSGAGFAPNEAGITLTYDGNPVGSGISASAQGTWNAPFVVPASAFGSHNIRASGSVTQAANVGEAAFSVAAGITLNRSTGTPGSSLTVFGSGFAANESGITVTFDGNPAVSGISANALGTWTSTFPVPPATFGNHTIRAMGAITSAATDQTFNVLGGISLSRSTGAVGSVITVSGSGFNPGETGIAVTYDGAPLMSGITASPQGAWNTTATIPPSPSGTHSIKASGSATQAASVGEAGFNVTPGISLGRATAGPGVSATVTGSGFGPGETGITVTYDGATVASGISANAQGSWSANFPIPPSTTGAHSVKASGSATQATSAPETSLTIGPSISLSRTAAGPGTSLTVTGAGFGPSEGGITVTYDGSPVASGISANAQGSWTATFTVPPSTSGVHTVRASGSATQVSAGTESGLSVGPSISSNRTSTTPGTSITIAGAGFGSNEGGITVAYDGNPVASGLSASPQGSWSAVITVPPSASGQHTVRASGLATQAAVAPEFNLTIVPGISVNRAGAAPGTPLTISGAGFGPGEGGIAVTYDGVALASGISANSLGSWTNTITIPASTSGQHTIRASGSLSQANAPEVNISIGPGMSLSGTSGAPGTPVTVNGAGFAPNETGITITYDGVTVASGLSANSQGSWNTVLTIPPSVSGGHSIKAYGPVSQVVNIAEATFNVAPGVTITPDSGNVSSRVDIAGSGFAPGSPLRLSYDDAEIPRNGLTTDAAGSFTRSFVIPKSKAGAHTIQAEDGQRRQAKAAFTMDGVSPPAPRLQAPGNGGRVSVTGNSTPSFRWTEVADPSGVTYVLQVDSTRDFLRPVLEKADLASASYELAEDEALPRGEYYWRVAAIDGASNRSGWSQPFLLKSGLMPMWLLLTMIVAAVAGAGGGAYYLLLRRRLAAQVAPAPEAVPPVIQAYWRELEPERRPKLEAPARKALPAPARAARSLPPELQARIKILADFAQSLPLAEPGYSVEWLMELVENATGEKPSPQVYEQLLQGQFVVLYQPAWANHPLYTELRALLEGQPVLEDLDKYVESVSRSASDGLSLVQDIYRDAGAEVAQDFVSRGGWAFVSAVYSDTLGWFRGKSLREPSDRDYAVKTADSPDGGPSIVWLYGVESTLFPGALVQAADEADAQRLRALHIQLRREYRASDKAKQLVAVVTQLQVQRFRLISALGQLGRFTEAS
ncbi:MAG: IPT/TIG domain-containing protein [Chloroflexi bacterium]|nr:IPT/TIG domain-containing protein [Chloroflexota bacterium]